MHETETPKTSKHKLSVSFDLRVIVGLLLLLIAAMLLIWKPWAAAPAADSRTISVSGEATVTAQPDEFVFSPNYEFQDADKATALTALTKKSDDVISKLKALGVADDKIKSNSNGDDYDYSYDDDTKTSTYELDLTITVTDKALAQKAQDYLVTTTPTGAVSPQADFSDAKRQQLESQARDQATKAARSKADQSAKNLGFTVAGVKSVTDGSGFNIGGGCGSTASSNIACPMTMSVGGAAGDKVMINSLNLQPGENNLSYTVQVTYYIR